MAFSEKKARELFEEVIKRLNESADKYKDAYVVNDMAKELNDEFYDIIGWPVMMVMRMQEAMEKRIYDFDNIYWDKFLANQQTDFLGKMQMMIVNELIGRQDQEAEQYQEVEDSIKEEITNFRSIRFYCKCGKELFEGTDFEEIGNVTLQEMLNTCECCDCTINRLKNV